MALSMTKAEREAFLAATRVAVLSVAEPGRGPLAVPVWYAYAPGDPVSLVTGGGSRKAALLRAAGRASLCVQTETAPYQYVSVEGPVVLVGPPDFERDVRRTALRYLGPEVGEAYLALSEEERAGSVLVHLTPVRWFSVDYAKMG